MQHGHSIRDEPVELRRAARFELRDVPEGHICCGSAGTYNILQPAIATRLRDRKVANIDRTAADAVATGNVGCITQIASDTGTPVLHMVELPDCATGGPKPPELAARNAGRTAPTPAAAEEPGTGTHHPRPPPVHDPRSPPTH